MFSEGLWVQWKQQNISSSQNFLLGKSAPSWQPDAETLTEYANNRKGWWLIYREPHHSREVTSSAWVWRRAAETRGLWNHLAPSAARWSQQQKLSAGQASSQRRCHNHFLFVYLRPLLMPQQQWPTCTVSHIKLKHQSASPLTFQTNKRANGESALPSRSH